MKENKWIRLLAYVTGLVNQELLLQNEYLAAENRVLRGHLPARLRLSDPEIHVGRNRQATRAQGSGPSRLRSQTRYHSGLVSQADYPQVRWLQVPSLSRQAPNRTQTGSPDRTDGQREFWLGVRPHCGRAGQSRLQNLRSDRRECSETPRDCASAEGEPNHDPEGIYSIAYGGVGRHRFLHGRSAHLAWLGDTLRLVLHSLGESACQRGRNHPESRPAMDAADGAQRDRRHLGISGAAAIRIARSRHQVLLGVSGNARGWWYKTD